MTKTVDLGGYLYLSSTVGADSGRRMHTWWLGLVMCCFVVLGEKKRRLSPRMARRTGFRPIVMQSDSRSVEKKSHSARSPELLTRNLGKLAILSSDRVGIFYKIYRLVKSESHEKLRIGSSRRFGKISSDLLHTYYMGPCQPVNELCALSLDY